MYHGMPSPALGWSSEKKAQDVALPEKRLFALRRAPLSCYLHIFTCTNPCAFLAMRNISLLP